MNWFDEDRGLDESDVLSPDEVVEPPAPGPGLTSSWSVKTDPGCESSDDADDDDGRDRDPDTGLSFDGTRRVYGLLCAMAHVDGRIAPAQRRELEDYQEYLGLSPFAARVLEDEARRSRSLRLGLRKVELDLLMGALIDMAAADGRLSPKEERLLERVNERAGWPGDAIADALVRALERARAVQPVHEPDPVTSSGDDLFGATIESSALRLEDSGDGDLVLPAVNDPVLPPAPRAESRARSREASASLAALAASGDPDVESTYARPGRAGRRAPRRPARVWF